MNKAAKQVVLITGSTDGLGRLVALQLAQQGSTVLLHGRDAAKGAALREQIMVQAPGASVRYYNADLASLQDVRTLAEQIIQSEARLDVLVNNAGIGPIAPGRPRRLSTDGNELLFAVNYLAGFLLSRALLPLLQRSAPSRIINVASIGQQPLDFDNLQLERDYDDARAYRQSKLAQILDTFTLAAAVAGSGISVNCLHPATLMDTKMVFEGTGYFPGVRSTTQQGADALLRLILAPELEAVSGRYFDGQQEARANDQAYDVTARRQLLDISQRLCNIT